MPPARIGPRMDEADDNTPLTAFFIGFFELCTYISAIRRIAPDHAVRMPVLLKTILLLGEVCWTLMVRGVRTRIQPEAKHAVQDVKKRLRRRPFNRRMGGIARVNHARNLSLSARARKGVPDGSG